MAKLYVLLQMCMCIWQMSWKMCRMANVYVYMANGYMANVYVPWEMGTCIWQMCMCHVKYVCAMANVYVYMTNVMANVYVYTAYVYACTCVPV